MLVRPSLNVFDAAVAAFGDVCFFGAFVWDKALPAADFEAFPVDLLVRVFEALPAVFGLVTFLFATFFSSESRSLKVQSMLNVVANKYTLKALPSITKAGSDKTPV